MNDFSGIILDKKDKEMLKAVSEYQTKNSLPGIKPFKLQGNLGWYNTTFNLHLKRLTENRLLIFTPKRLIDITKLGKKKCSEPKTEAKANEPVAKKEKRRPSKREKEVTREERIKFHFLFNAANGVTFEKIMSNDRKFHPKPIKVTSSTTMTELLSNQVISASPFTSTNRIQLDTVKGVAIDDFFSDDALITLPAYSHLREIGFNRPELQRCVNELESQGRLGLKAVCGPQMKFHRNKKRYQILDPLLQELIEDLYRLMVSQLERIRLEWPLRDPTKEEMKWLRFMLSDATAINFLSYYAELRKALEHKQTDKDLEKMIFMTIDYNRNSAANGIRSADKKISEIRQNILTKYHDVKDKYPYELMLRHANPRL